MKKKIFTLSLGIMIISCIFASCCFSATKNSNENIVTEEMVQNIVDEKVQTAVNGAVSQMQASMETDENLQNENEQKSNGIGMIAAAIATGLACIGSGIAVAVVASSAVGAISENPELLGKTIIFAGLAEGIAIYGLIISIMILNKI